MSERILEVLVYLGVFAWTVSFATSILLLAAATEHVAPPAPVSIYYCAFQIDKDFHPWGAELFVPCRWYPIKQDV